MRQIRHVLPPAPRAVRGYNVGELAACRRYAELAAEVRVPLLRQQLYAFAEWGSDLGSSGEHGQGWRAAARPVLLSLLLCIPCTRPA